VCERKFVRGHSAKDLKDRIDLSENYAVNIAVTPESIPPLVGAVRAIFPQERRFWPKNVRF